MPTPFEQQIANAVLDIKRDARLKPQEFMHSTKRGVFVNSAEQRAKIAKLRDLQSEEKQKRRFARKPNK